MLHSRKSIRIINSPHSSDYSCLTATKSAYVQYLGVTLDDRLSWRAHIATNALDQTVMGYYIRVWGSALKTHLLTLYKKYKGPNTK